MLTNDSDADGDSFRYRVSDGSATSDVARVELKVRPVNDAPDCTSARAFPASISKVSQRFQTVTILGCTDVDSGDRSDGASNWLWVQITSIFQDEPVARPGMVSVPLDAALGAYK